MGGEGSMDLSSVVDVVVVAPVDLDIMRNKLKTIQRQYEFNTIQYHVIRWMLRDVQAFNLTEIIQS